MPLIHNLCKYRQETLVGPSRSLLVFYTLILIQLETISRALNENVETEKEQNHAELKNFVPSIPQIPVIYRTRITRHLVMYRAGPLKEVPGNRTAQSFTRFEDCKKCPTLEGPALHKVDNVPKQTRCRCRRR